MHLLQSDESLVNFVPWYARLVVCVDVRVCDSPGSEYVVYRVWVCMCERGGCGEQGTACGCVCMRVRSVRDVREEGRGGRVAQSGQTPRRAACRCVAARPGHDRSFAYQLQHLPFPGETKDTSKHNYFKQYRPLHFAILRSYLQHPGTDSVK